MVLSVYLFFLRQFLSVSIGFYLFSFVFCLLFYPFLSVLSPLFSFLSVSIYLICFSSVFICFKIWDFLKTYIKMYVLRLTFERRKKIHFLWIFEEKNPIFLKVWPTLGTIAQATWRKNHIFRFFCWKNPKSMIFCSRWPMQ